MAEHPLEDLFVRLDRERQEADRLYNEALTVLDRALQQAPRLPPAPPLSDDHQLDALNRGWNILPEGGPAVDRSAKGRLRTFVWRLIGPPLEAQNRFNAALTDHLNRDASVRHAAQEGIGAILQVARHEFEALARFKSLLIQFLQTITAYVDTKDRSGGASELRDRLTLAEQRIMALKRASDDGPADRPRRASTPSGSSDPSTDAFAGHVDSLTYVGFEDRFRGSQEDIRRRLGDYLPILASVSDVVDVGCGRGELLDLLRERGVIARGVDTNHAMVELCRTRGLAVEQSDGLTFLERQADASVGGLVAIQVVEHMEPAYLLRFVETAYHKLRAGAPLILETINPACWMAFFECFIRDLTHQRPLHPDTLRYLVQASGFTTVDIQYREPVRDADRLERLPVPAGAAAELTPLVTAINAHADKLNARLFSSMDYAVIARR